MDGGTDDVADGSTEDATDGGTEDDADGGAIDPTDAGECEPESPEQVCERHGAACGVLTADDNCDQDRRVDCGTGCSGNQTCGGDEPNECGCACEIEDECLQPGQSPEGRPCVKCDPDESDNKSQVEDGTACGENRVCQNGNCSCEGERVECQGLCVDTRTNPNYCGSCEKSCPNAELCESGKCLDGCNDRTKCDGRCVNTESNDDHCGDCGNECEGCNTCAEGDCEPDASKCSPCETCGGAGECNRRIAPQPAGESCNHDCECFSGSCRGGTCAHRIFVTSEPTGPNPRSMGTGTGPLSEMDGICQTLADDANLGGTWKAIVSTGPKPAKNRLTVDGPVENLDAEDLASNGSDLWDGRLDNTVLYNETGNEQRGGVWTGTDESGDPTPSIGTDVRCREWTSNDQRSTAMTGHSGRLGKGWIAKDEQSCDRRLRLYCIDGQQ